MICKRCVLPESAPDIRLDDQGVCNICQEHERSKPPRKKLLETDFIKLLKIYKSNGEYDCLVMCSGGKDSTAALYYMKERYKLNPLAFTFDHGFETEEAIRNVQNATKILGVDFLLFKSSFMQEMFAEIVRTDSRAVICHPCSIWYMDLAFKTAFRYNIPMIIAGWTKGQSFRQPMLSKCGCNIQQPEFRSMGEATKDFLDAYVKREPKYRDFPRSMEEVLRRARLRQRCAVLSPHWFLPQEAEDYLETIKKELNWRPAKLSYPSGSTNCSLNSISVYYSMKHYGYTHYHVEMSKLIREGLLTREEALKRLEVNFPEELLDSIAEKLGCRCQGSAG